MIIMKQAAAEKITIILRRRWRCFASITPMLKPMLASELNFNRHGDITHNAR